MTDNTIDDLSDIFGIPYVEKSAQEPLSIESSPSFEERLGDLASISDVPPTKSLEVKAAEPTTEETKKEADLKPVDAIKGVLADIVQEQPKPIGITDISAAETVESTVDNSIAPWEEEDVEKIGAKESKEEDSEQVSTVVLESTGDTCDLPDGEISWNMNCPSPKLSAFYQEKARLIQMMTGGKQIAFSRLEEELKNSRVNIVCEIFDGHEIHRKMQEVQQFKDRVAQIQIEINSQYFRWERMVDLLAGFLARTQYERGKQEGIIYEHMKEMYDYFNRIKSVYKSADIVQKNLDSAFDVLSRQITISMPQRNIDRNMEGFPVNNAEHIYSETSFRPDVACTKEVPKEIAGYDDLPTGGSVASMTASPEKIQPAKGTKFTGWGEINVQAKI
jgi:hypothetical protein